MHPELYLEFQIDVIIVVGAFEQLGNPFWEDS